MVALYTIATILFLHWVFDFHLQDDDMAKGKSSCNRSLTDHVAVYTVGLIVMGLSNVVYFHNWSYVAVFVILNAIIHWCVDWVTSRASSSLFKEGRVHDFFVVVGFDQYLHAISLFGTFVWLTNL